MTTHEAVFAGDGVEGEEDAEEVSFDGALEPSEIFNGGICDDTGSSRAAHSVVSLIDAKGLPDSTPGSGAGALLASR